MIQSFQAQAMDHKRIDHHRPHGFDSLGIALYDSKKKRLKLIKKHSGKIV